MKKIDNKTTSTRPSKNMVTPHGITIVPSPGRQQHRKSYPASTNQPQNSSVALDTISSTPRPTQSKQKTRAAAVAPLREGKGAAQFSANVLRAACGHQGEERGNNPRLKRLVPPTTRPALSLSSPPEVFPFCPVTTTHRGDSRPPEESSPQPGEEDQARQTLLAPKTDGINWRRRPTTPATAPTPCC